MFTHLNVHLIRTAGALLIVASLSVAPTQAQMSSDSVKVSSAPVETVEYGSLLPAEMREQMRLAVERLELTEEQRDPVHTIIERSSEQRLAVMEKYGMSLERMTSGDLPNMSTLRRMGGEMEALDKDTEKRLKRVLTPDQMDTWKEIERERQRQMRAQMRSRR